VHVIAYRKADIGDNGLVVVAVNDHPSDALDLHVSAGRYSFRYSLPPGVATFAWDQPTLAI
jgi:hypothetical protein